MRTGFLWIIDDDLLSNITLTLWQLKGRMVAARPTGQSLHNDQNSVRIAGEIARHMAEIMECDIATHTSSA